MQTMFGLFKNRESVNNAIERLQSEGFNTKDFSFKLKSTAPDTEKNSGSDIATGAAIGAVIGAITGLILAISIPGINTFFIGGQIAALLFLSGASALIGGAIGSLTALGLQRTSTKESEEQSMANAVMLAVPARKGEESFVKHTLEYFGAYDMKAIEQPFTNTDKDSTDSYREERSNESFRPAVFGYSTPMAGVKGGSADRTSESRSSEKKVSARKGDVIRIVVED